MEDSLAYNSIKMASKGPWLRVFTLVVILFTLLVTIGLLRWPGEPNQVLRLESSSEQPVEVEKQEVKCKRPPAIDLTHYCWARLFNGLLKCDDSGECEREDADEECTVVPRVMGAPQLPFDANSNIPTDFDYCVKSLTAPECQSPTTKVPKDPRFIREYSPTSTLDLDRLRKKKYYFFGISVTRHYASKLQQIFENSSTIDDRLTEKAKCELEAISSSSCSFKVQNGGGIQFFWKPMMGMEYLHFEYGIDACRQDVSTRECLSTAFLNATENDVLLLGTLATANGPYYKLRGSDAAPKHQFFQAIARSGLYANLPELLDMVHSIFPGTILWHSYPHTVSSTNYLIPNYNADLCFVPINKRMACAAEYSSRMVYFDFTDLQSRNESLYLDWIHHPGPLSETIVEILLRHIAV